MSRRDDALASVNEERDRQYKIWGDQHHSIPEWLMILGEEFGEACEAGVRLTFETHGEGLAAVHLGKVRNEIVQTAAVAVQMIEYIDATLHPDRQTDERADTIATRAPISSEAAGLMAVAIERCTIHDACKDALQHAAETFVSHGYSEDLVLMALRRWASGFYPVQMNIGIKEGDDG